MNSFTELGKAGRHFKLGACISYHGKERDVSHFLSSMPLCLSLKCYAQIDTYEVLVEANLPTRWVYQPLLPSLPLEAPTVPFAVGPRPALQVTLA